MWEIIIIFTCWNAYAINEWHAKFDDEGNNTAIIISLFVLLPVMTSTSSMSQAVLKRHGERMADLLREIC